MDLADARVIVCALPGFTCNDGDPKGAEDGRGKTGTPCAGLRGVFASWPDEFDAGVLDVEMCDVVLGAIVRRGCGTARRAFALCIDICEPLCAVDAPGVKTTGELCILLWPEGIPLLMKSAAVSGMPSGVGKSAVLVGLTFSTLPAPTLSLLEDFFL